jgi:predicted DCC family thiol-disulfide oxidoreductase YuxK
MGLDGGKHLRPQTVIRTGPDRETEPSGEPFDRGVWLIYDGECPMCTHAAIAFRIREAAGSLNLIDARTAPDHALVREASELGYDLDEGMVLRYAGIAHHGEDALVMMATLGSPIDWFNRLIVLLFKSGSSSWHGGGLLRRLGQPSAGHAASLRGKGKFV